MDICDTMRENMRRYRTACGIEQKELSLRLGLSKNVICNWENGRSKPDPSLLPLICDILGITLDELYGITRQDSFTDKEKRLVSDYRCLNAGNQKITDRMIETMLQVQKTMPAPRLLKLLSFDRALAAGTGDPTEWEQQGEEIYIYENEENRKANYVFRVSGDSMEPRFHSGDRVLVQKTPKDYQPKAGEIGAFIIGNEMYIKEYQEDGLHSLNPAYGMVETDKDHATYMIGKVLCVLDESQVADIERTQP